MKVKLVILLFGIVTVLNAAYNKGYVVNIISDSKLQTEMIQGEERRVILPFNTEYSIRLKNDSEDNCACRIFIDGRIVNSLGDLVLYKNQIIDLNRFVESSLTEGKKFLFVKQTDFRVDDPNRKENGIIKVEYRKEKKHQYIIPQPQSEPNWIFPWGEGTITSFWWNVTNNCIPCGAYIDTSMLISHVTVNCSVSVPGATVGGSDSFQTFSKVSMEFEEEPVYIVELRLYGNEDFCKK